MPLEITVAHPGDYAHFAALFPELQSGDAIPAHDLWVKEMAPTTVFARSEGELAGYCYFNMLKDTGYVRHVAVDPAWRRKGIGKAIMNEMASRFRRWGAAQWCLNVKPDNVLAIRLYQAVGMSRAYSSTAFNLPWAMVDRLPDFVAAKASQVQPREDAAIEAAFSLPSGQIAEARAFGDRILLGIYKTGQPAAFASFNPSFPGAFPFRVREPALVRNLLEAMRPHARPDLPHVGVVIEDDRESTQLLLRSGAEVKMSFDHYRGSLA